MTTLIFHEDPGHGWLQVPAAELRRLGIADKISGCSYVSRDGKYAFLEEDCDLSTYARAAGWTGFPRDIEERHTNSDSFVRFLPRYEQGRLT